MGAVDSVTTRIGSGCNKFWDWVSLLTTTLLLLGTKGRLYSPCVCNVCNVVKVRFSQLKRKKLPEQRGMTQRMGVQY